MKIQGKTAFVTGANRGIGAEFVTQLKARGAAKIYAAARDASSVTADGVEPIELDVTDAGAVAACAAALQDVDLLINNAGIVTGQSLVSGDLDQIRLEMEVNAFGPLLLARGFAGTLGARGGGAILNVVSGASWMSAPGATTYALSKAAQWSLTDGLRVELAAQGTQVLALHMGLVDTEMTAHVPGPKAAASDVVAMALDGLEAGASEVLGDDMTRAVKERLGDDPAERYAMFLTTADASGM